MSKVPERLPNTDYVETFAVKNYNGGLSLIPKITAKLAETQRLVEQAQVALDPSEWRAQFSSVGELQTGGIKMLIEGFLPEGVSMIGALAGEGKTLFALSIAKSVSTGKLFLDRFVVPERVPILYLIPESSGGSFRGRCEKFAIPDDPDWFLSRTISNGPTLLMNNPFILAAVNHMKPLVILDTAIRFNSTSDENSSMGNKVFSDEALALITNGARGVLGLHHATKSSRKDGLTLESALRGTGDLAAMCDSVYGLKRNNSLYEDGAGPLELEVVCLKPRDFEPPLPFTIAASEMKDGKVVSIINANHDFVVRGQSEMLQGLDDRFSRFVEEFPNSSFEEVAEGLGVKKRVIQRMADKNKYTKPRGGKWHKLTTPEVKLESGASDSLDPESQLKAFFGDDKPGQETGF